MPSSTNQIMSEDHLTAVEYLKSLKSVRESCEKVYAAVKSGNHPEARFDVDEGKLDEIAEYVAGIIRRDYADPTKDVPPHSRWRHFLPKGSIEASIVDPMRASGKDETEIVKSLLDLFVVSVLLDAGAGDRWVYQRDSKSAPVGRSEGLAMASMDMFIKGLFSTTASSVDDRLKVDGSALMVLKEDHLAAGLQVDEVKNPLVGLKGRLELLRSLGNVLTDSRNEKFFFNPEDGSHRPGNLVYYLLAHSDSSNRGISVEIETLWRVVVEGFGGVWPTEGRIKVENVYLGDVWKSKILSKEGDSDGNESNFHTQIYSLVCFHKLSQWLTYSLLEPLEQFLKIQFTNKSLMTGLAEYRNGGLFVDFGALQLKQPYDVEMGYKPSDEVIIQWRALTVCLLDRLAPILRHRLGVTEEEFSLPKMLEGGTWKAGREIAKKMRPETAGPPIKIISDGTLF